MATESAAPDTAARYASSGRAHGGRAGSFGEALGYGKAIGGGIEAGLWNGAVLGPLNLGASKIGQKISSDDTDTWLGKPALLKEREINAAFLDRMDAVWDGFEFGDGSFGQKLKDTVFAGYNSAFQNFLEGAGRYGSVSREALYLGSNTLFHALKKYALPAITGSYDKDYNARWLTGRAYEVGDRLTEKVSSVPGLQYVDNEQYQKDLAASSPSVNLAGKVSRSVANMLPSIALALATKKPDAGLIAMSASAAGNAAKEAYEDGATPEQAYYIGLEKGYFEYLTESKFDALGVFGGGTLTPGMESLLGDYAASKVGRGLVKAGGILGENIEESVSDWAGTGIERAVLGRTIGGKEDKSLAQALAGQAPWTEDGLVTLLSTLALNGGGQIVNSAQSSFDKAASAKQQANEAAYLRRMEEIGHLTPESSKNAAPGGAAKEVQKDGVQKNDSLQTRKTRGIISAKISERGEVINPMPPEEYDYLKDVLDSQGIEVFAAESGDDLRYMMTFGAEGTYSNGRITHIGKVPSRGTMYEEIIHLAQSRMYGELDGTDFVELYAREIEAQRILLENKDALNLDELDIADIVRNLAYWEKQFKQAEGESYDESHYRDNP